MQLSVIIPTVRPAHLDETIASICRQEWREWELIVVAQGNDPALKARVAKGHEDPRIRFVHLQQSGLSLARNAGIEAARHPLVLFTDDDCVADPEWLTIMAQCFAANPQVGLIGGALVKPTPARRGMSSCPFCIPSESIYDPVATPHKPPSGWGFVGGNLAIRRAMYARVGPFDTRLGPGARFPVADDVDYGFRLERAGIPMLSTPRAIVHHAYGTRYGMRAILKNSDSYARGNGAMAAKLTLMGDARGREWRDNTRRECTVDSLRYLRPHRLPFALRRWRMFETAYQDCVTRFCVDGQGLLQPRGSD